MTALTPRQREVLGLRARGLTVMEAADRMGVSFAAARAHSHDAYERLGARCLAEALLASGIVVLADEGEP